MTTRGFMDCDDVHIPEPGLRSLAAACLVAAVLGLGWLLARALGREGRSRRGRGRE